MATEMVVNPVLLEGLQVRLEPLARTHLEGLAAVGLDEELWRWIPTAVRTREEMAVYIETALSEQEPGASLPFAIVEKATGRTIAAHVTAILTVRIIGWRLAGRGWRASGSEQQSI